MPTQSDHLPLVGAMTSVSGLDWLSARTTAAKKKAVALTRPTGEILARDRADEVQELNWLALSADLRRRQT